MENWVERCKTRLSAKIENGDPCGDVQRCISWMGCIRANGYGWVKAEKLTGERQSMNAHRFVYMVYAPCPDIPPYHDISHLCHNKSCVNLAHLSCEMHGINVQRTNCSQMKKCTGHGNHPPCINLGLKHQQTNQTTLFTSYIVIVLMLNILLTL